jgi:putative endonuclease
VKHFVYIVRCADGTLYTGYARDPHKRVQVHNAGRGARYTSGRRPVRLVYAEAFRLRTAALKREYRLKRLSRLKKEALIQGWTVVIEKDSPVGTALPTSKIATQ